MRDAEGREDGLGVCRSEAKVGLKVRGKERSESIKERGERDDRGSGRGCGKEAE